MFNNLKYYVLTITFCIYIIKAQAQYSKDYYSNAFIKIENMLNENDSLDFKKAVFFVENSYFENQIIESGYYEYVKFYASVCRGIMKSGHIVYPEKDIEEASAQCAVFMFMTDTIPVTINDKVIIHLPCNYNYDDYAGKKDWSNMFVSKLMQTNYGNCHSLPYLYKIIMNELGYGSYLALAPNHIYIKAQNKRTGWYNIELTCADFPTDAWYVASGYIHTDAVRNKIYMKALTEKESVALCLVDLAQGYRVKFGIEDGSFILKCCDTALAYFPNYINAMLLKAETLAALHKRSDPDTEENEKLFVQMNELYTHIHNLGYRKMPQGMYLSWLNRFGKENSDHRMKSLIVHTNEDQ